MGRIKYIAPADEIAGSIGGVTFARAYGIQTVRAWRMPVNARTTQQLLRRRILASYSSRWFEDLSQSQRDTWDAYAATCTFTDSLGKTYYINGFAMFLRTMAIRACYSVAENLSGPIASGFPTTRVLDLSLVHATGVLSCNTVTPAGVATDRHLFRVLQFNRITRNHFRFRTENFFDNDAATGLPFTIHTYGALPGSSADYAAWLEYRYLDSINRVTQPTLYKVVSA